MLQCDSHLSGCDRLDCAHHLLRISKYGTRLPVSDSWNFVLSARDIPAAKEGKAESYVCIGYDQDAKITKIAFQPNGNLLVCS